MKEPVDSIEALFDAPTTRVADVLIPVAVDINYSYRFDAALDLRPGDFVDVPLGAREASGVVWSVGDKPGGANLKRVIGRRDFPPLREPLRQFVDWVARWTLAPRGMVLRMGVRAPDAAGPEPIRIGVRLTGGAAALGLTWNEP